VTEASKDTPLSDVPKGTLFWGANGASASTVAVHSTQSVLASREAGRDNLIGILSIGIGAISDDQFSAGICGALSGEWWTFEIIQTKQFLVWKLRPLGVSCPSVDGDGEKGWVRWCAAIFFVDILCGAPKYSSAAVNDPRAPTHSMQ
jgi:hypothetical protein